MARKVKVPASRAAAEARPGERRAIPKGRRQGQGAAVTGCGQSPA